MGGNRTAAQMGVWAVGAYRITPPWFLCLFGTYIDRRAAAGLRYRHPLQTPGPLPSFVVNNSPELSLPVDGNAVMFTSKLVGIFTTSTVVGVAPPKTYPASSTKAMPFTLRILGKRTVTAQASVLAARKPMVMPRMRFRIVESFTHQHLHRQAGSFMYPSQKTRLG